MTTADDAPAVLALGEDGVDAWSYARLHATVQRLTGGMATQGIRHGEPVALVAASRPEWITAWLYAFSIGLLTPCTCGSRSSCRTR